MVQDRNVKFGTPIHHQGYQRQKCKIRSKVVGNGSRDLILKFCDPSVSRKRLELEMSNLATRFNTRFAKDSNAKLGQRGRNWVK